MQYIKDTSTGHTHKTLYKVKKPTSPSIEPTSQILAKVDGLYLDDTFEAACAIASALNSGIVDEGIRLTFEPFSNISHWFDNRGTDWFVVVACLVSAEPTETET